MQNMMFFFYQFTRKDQSKSEEAQRAKLKAANKPPPSLPALSMNFSGLTFLLQSELMLHLMRLVLHAESRYFSESRVQKVLYLLGMALVEEERMRKINPNTTFRFTKKAMEIDMLETLEVLTGSHRIDR